MESECCWQMLFIFLIEVKYLANFLLIFCFNKFCGVVADIASSCSMSVGEEITVEMKKE
jgi:hypothetical protein